MKKLLLSLFTAAALLGPAMASGSEAPAASQDFVQLDPEARQLIREKAIQAFNQDLGLSGEKAAIVRRHFDAAFGRILFRKDCLQLIGQNLDNPDLPRLTRDFGGDLVQKHVCRLDQKDQRAFLTLVVRTMESIEDSQACTAYARNGRQLPLELASKVAIQGFQRMSAQEFEDYMVMVSHVLAPGVEKRVALKIDPAELERANEALAQVMMQVLEQDYSTEERQRILRSMAGPGQPDAFTACAGTKIALKALLKMRGREGRILLQNFSDSLNK